MMRSAMSHYEIFEKIIPNRLAIKEIRAFRFEQ